MEKTIKIYDRENYIPLLSGLKVLRINKIETNENLNNVKIPNLEDLNISTSLMCSSCKLTFENNIQQRQHYKSDWHRYNLKQSLKSLDSITEDKFEQLADDVSSISGSDSESEDDSEQEAAINAVHLGKIYFTNEHGKIFSMYRSLLHDKKNAPACDEALLKIVRQSSKNTIWVVLMLGGGHFAGAIYHGADVLVHKTFHHYTVRAKQGGAQNSAKCATKSAGANLRRYNEQSLSQHISDLLESWSAHIEQSHLIFYRAAGPFNRTVFFGGKNPVLKKNDTRLRNIPFATKRPTFTELKRVHDVLTSIDIYNSFESIKSQFTVQKSNNEDGGDSPRQSRRESPTKNKTINRAKSRESKEAGRPVPGVDEESSSSEESENEEDFCLESENLELSFNELKQYEDTVPEEVKKKKKLPKKKKPKKKDRIKKWEESLKRELYNACIKGDLQLLKTTLAAIKEDPTECEEKYQMNATKALNLAIDEHGNTALHIAASNNHGDMILWLMENESSPCNKNDKQNTPYTINSDKTTRNIFRSFAADNPDKYNYAKSQIPVIVATITDEELAEKKKAQRKAKREREKEKRKENEIKRKEEDDRNRFLKLSDREKRALAAERRILAQSSAVLVRCFLCAEDISGKVPFEYSGNRFCSITCLKAHRLQTPVVLS